LRFWEWRNIGGTLERKRVTCPLGEATTRGKHPPIDIKQKAERKMASVNSGAIPPDRITTIGDFVERVYLPWVEQHKRPPTVNGYLDIWGEHLQPLAAHMWLKDIRTFHVQGWLDEIGRQDHPREEDNLSRNTLKHIKSVLSGIFTVARQLDYFSGENPVHGARTNPKAREAKETHAYNIQEIAVILSVLPELASVIVATAAFMGLRRGELSGLQWPDYSSGEIQVRRSIWRAHVSDPKTQKGRAPVPVIKQLGERLEMHRLREGNPDSGPIFRNSKGKTLSLTALAKRVIVPALNRCAVCGKTNEAHKSEEHEYRRDPSLPEWHGWHAFRRGLGSNLYALGVADKVIQKILRHANVSTTLAYYVKPTDEAVKKAMAKLETTIPEGSQSLSDSNRTVKGDSPEQSPTVQ
jgi:integrase